MNQLSEQAIIEFQQVYQEVMGKEISYERASELAHQFMHFVYLILKKR